MTRLIMTTSDSGAGCLREAGLADIVIPFGLRLVWGPVPSATEFAKLFAPPSANEGVPSWLKKFSQARKGLARKSLGLLELCHDCEAIELWIDPEPNAQLQLIRLLDYFRSDANIASKLTLRQTELRIDEQAFDAVAEWRPAAVKIEGDHFEVASRAWQAYTHPTPETWFNLLTSDLSALPRLAQAALELLEELPAKQTGIGATEMRMLELISAGNVNPCDVFPGDRKPNNRGVFEYWEVGHLLDGLANGPTPAISGLDEGPFTIEMNEDGDRHQRYRGSKLNLTPFGEAVMAASEDFSRHNPIRRWWGGTELTNDCLWRWDAAHRALIRPDA